MTEPRARAGPGLTIDREYVWTVFERCVGVFMRRIAGGNKEHAVERKLIGRLVRHFEMG